MSRLSFRIAALLAAGVIAAAGDTVQLKEKASITGTVLAEKGDSIAVDVGFTVLVIPRKDIVKIVKGEETAKPPSTRKPAKTPAAEPKIDPAPEGAIFRSAPKNGAIRSVRDLVGQLGGAVVQVRTPGGLGSGFILNEDGSLITNFHVIEGETQIWVEVYHEKDGQLERKTYKQVRIIAMNKFADLALLRIEDKDAPKFKIVSLGSTDGLAVGERVFAIGSPLGLERTVTEGILSTKTRQMQGALYLQTTAQINPGNSGGPLFNLAGDVIGVTNMKLAFGEGLGFAIPVEAVKFFLENRDAYSYSPDNPGTPYRYLDPPSRLQHPSTTVEQ